MKAKWMVWVAMLALGLAAGAGATRAQDRPRADRPEAPPALADEGDPLEDLDGLGMLLAAGEDPDPAPGQGPGGMMGPGMHRGPGMGPGARADLHQRLNLTDDQKGRLADIHDRMARQAVPIRGDLEIAQLDLHKLMRADKPDQRAIDLQIDKISALRARLQKSRVAGMLEARNILTPAQQKILHESHPMMGRGVRGMRGMHGMGSIHGGGVHDGLGMGLGTHL